MTKADIQDMVDILMDNDIIINKFSQFGDSLYVFSDDRELRHKKSGEWVWE